MSAENTSSDTQDALTSIFESTSVNVVGTFLTRGIGFISMLLLTNTLTESQFGVYVYITTLISVVGVFSQFGAKQSLMKFVPRYNSETRNDVFGLALSISILGNMLFGILLYLLAPFLSSVTTGGPSFVTVLRLFSITLFLNSIRITVTSGFRGLELSQYGIFVDRILSPIIRLAAIGGAILFGHKLVGISIGILFSAAAVLIASIILLFFLTDLRPRFAPERKLLREYGKYASTLLTRSVGMTLYTKIDILILGVLAATSNVAVYKIAWALAVIVDLPLNGVGQVFPSIASRYHSQGLRDELAEVFRIVTKFTFVSSLLLFTGTVVFRTELLRLFGEQYAQVGTGVLLLVSLAQLISNAVGPQGYILLMTGYQRLNTMQIWAFGLLNVVLNLLLIPEYGILGAASAMFISYVLLDVLQVIEVWHLRGYFPFSYQLLNPLPIGVVAGAVMVGFRELLGGFSSILIGGFIGSVVYIVLVWLFVVDESDIAALQEFRS